MAKSSEKSKSEKSKAKDKLARKRDGAVAAAAPAPAAPRNLLRLQAGRFTFLAKLELEAAPQTCRAFIKALPFRSSFVHVRWSGEGVWVPLGERDFGVGYENHTSFPAPGQMLLYPTGISETELIMAYGGVRFACKMGQLAGNHFLTVVEGGENLAALGKACLWEGAQELVIDWA